MIDYSIPPHEKTITYFDAAISLANLDLYVFPVHSIRDGCCTCDDPACGSPGKHPLVKWREESTTDGRIIETWSARWSWANVGIDCGKSGLYVVDIDGDPGIDEWSELLADNSYPPTVGCYTGGGGMHIYFKRPPGELRNTSRVLAPHIDTRGDGGFVLAPPSNHISGGRYRWIKSPEEIPLADLPGWIVAAVRPQERPQEKTRDNNGRFTGNREKWLLEAISTATIGNGDDTGLWLACQLRDDGLPEPEIFDVCLQYAQQVKQDPRRPFIDKDARRWTRSALSRPARDPARGNGHYMAETVIGHGIPDEGRGAVPQTPPTVEPPPNFNGEDRRKYPKGAEYVQFLEGCGYSFRLCELDDSLWVNDERMTDAREAEIKTRLRDGGYLKVNVAADAYLAHALHNSFNPIKDYLRSLRWDGRDHIAELAGYFTDKHGNFPLILRKWMIGAVARVETRGRQNRVMVLEGLQDIGKSYFSRWLASPLEDHFSEAPPNPDDKDSRLALATTWIWEIKELGSVTRRADREALKAWLTLESISERPPYGKHPIYKPAITSFIATVNNEGGFFNDPTGSRRYMTAALTSIDWDYAHQVNVNQVWAQAIHLFESGEDWNLNPDEKARIERVNEEYEFTPPVYDWLDVYIDDATDEFTPTADILAAIKSAGVGGSEKMLIREIAGWMKKHGYQDSKAYIKVRKMTGEKSKQVRGYRDCTIGRKAFTLPEF